MPNEHKINIVKDTSEKIKNSSGEFIVLMNNDVKVTMSRELTLDSPR